jgi:hypothetical protein
VVSPPIVPPLARRSPFPVEAAYPHPLPGSHGQGGRARLVVDPVCQRGIGGAASRSTAKPIKTANFLVNLNKFNDAETYSE